MTSVALAWGLWALGGAAVGAALVMLWHAGAGLGTW